MVYGKGINDMEKGWKRKNKENLRKYSLWHSMLCRCYDEKYHKKYPTYKNCYVCDRWLKLSNFLKDIEKLENYEEWLKHIDDKRNIYELDKDIKSNGNNKCYCSEQCMFVTNKDNTLQAMKTRDNSYLQKENNPMYGKNHTDNTKKSIREKRIKSKVAQYDQQGNFIKIWMCAMDAERELKINHSDIGKCCRKERKTAGGFVWEYYKEEK